MRLKGKRALVTGGASGIGYAIVERFLQEGAAVAFCDINADGCRKAEQQFVDNGGKVKGIVGDVSKSADAQRMAGEAVTFLGGLDILVNNAGIDTLGTLLNTDDETWDRQIAVNLGGVFRMSKYSVPAIIQSGGGAVVNLGSVAAFIGFKTMVGYGASKGAVVQFTRNLAASLAEHGIRVNSVNPGVVDTPLLEHACRALAGPGGDWQEVKQVLTNGQLLKRVARPAEIASAVLFLASDEASFITGAALMVDGGFVIQE